MTKRKLGRKIALLQVEIETLRREVNGYREWVSGITDVLNRNIISERKKREMLEKYLDIHFGIIERSEGYFKNSKK